MKTVIFLIIYLSIAAVNARVPAMQSEANYFTSIEEDIAWLESLDRHLPLHDKRLLFANIYHQVTLEMPKLFAEEKFENPEWVLKLMLKYVSLYKHALDCSLQKICFLSPSWIVAFNSHRENKLKPGIQLLLSISAHVNRDLPIALAAIETDFKDPSMQRDYRKIALIFDRRMTSLIKVMRSFQRCRVGPLDRKIVDRVIRWAMNSTRDRSWEYGKRLSKTKNNLEEEKLLEEIEAQTKKQNKFILRYAPAGEFGICN